MVLALYIVSVQTPRVDPTHNNGPTYKTFFKKPVLYATTKPQKKKTTLKY